MNDLQTIERNINGNTVIYTLWRSSGNILHIRRVSIYDGKELSFNPQWEKNLGFPT
jgi:hypothetical protein